LKREVADTVARALRAESGSVLAFLPGAGEIRRTETFLRERITILWSTSLRYMVRSDATVQDRAIAPAPAGRRKVVLATSIAEPRSRSKVCASWWIADCRAWPRYEPTSD